MSTNQILILIIIIAVLLLIIGAVTHKVEIFINLVLKSLMGIVGIYFVNFVLVSIGLELGVGINLLTILTVGLLGIPGFILVFGIGLYYYI